MTQGSLVKAGVSLVSARCDRIRESVTVEQLFTHMGWDWPSRPNERVLCLWPDHDDHSPDMQVYADNNSVYCFACSRGGGVIELVRYVVAGSTPWSLDRTLDWLEQTFKLPPMSPTESLRNRLQKAQRARSRSPSGTSLESWNTAKAVVLKTFDQAEAAFPVDVRVTAHDFREYIWAEAEGWCVDPLAWASWARGIILGSYANGLALVQQALGKLEMERPSWIDLLWDDERTVDAACLWETHRGREFESPWPVYCPLSAIDMSSNMLDDEEYDMDYDDFVDDHTTTSTGALA